MHVTKINSLKRWKKICIYCFVVCFIYTASEIFYFYEKFSVFLLLRYVFYQHTIIRASLIRTAHAHACHTFIWSVLFGMKIHDFNVISLSSLARSLACLLALLVRGFVISFIFFRCYYCWFARSAHTMATCDRCRSIPKRNRKNIYYIIWYYYVKTFKTPKHAFYSLSRFLVVNSKSPKKFLTEYNDNRSCTDTDNNNKNNNK